MTRLVDEFTGRYRRPVRILNCMGMRAEESPARMKRTMLELDQGASNGKRTVYTWLPLHTWTVKRVWSEIARSGLPYSPVYDWGGCPACRAHSAYWRPSATLSSPPGSGRRRPPRWSAWSST
ncbi:phosphoadenosine phosphosulfate reductase domain-containing protein [Streptomyces clavifer]|uniref:phosphoadenosine phosphosulfate reductase domain-containing protein n=1 Tax=Streptomyces clavifer TaxID=68188 RepID=UPI003649AC60